MKVSVDGGLVIDKPAGWTSHDVVAKVRRIAGEKSVGHLGTLDPLATGVLPLLLGRATRLARFFTANEKKYDAVVRFGIATDTYDRDGEVTASAEDFEVTREGLERALDSFRGSIQQTPPPVSAKKVGGVPAYKLARKKVEVVLAPVGVTVHSLELEEFDGRQARLLVHCSAGTYIRGIAHDLGKMLGCGAMLESLVRTASGGFTLEQACKLAALEAGGVSQYLVPPAQLLPQFPSERVDVVTVNQIRQGREFRVSPFRTLQNAKYVKAVGERGELVAIGELRLPHVYHPVLVL